MINLSVLLYSSLAERVEPSPPEDEALPPADKDYETPPEDEDYGPPPPDDEIPEDELPPPDD